MDTTTAAPAQIDAEIARIHGEMAKHERVLDAKEGRFPKAQVDHAIDSINRLNDEAAPLYAQYHLVGGWTRYYLVEGGHLHFDCTWGRCSRIPSTRHYWMTELSGMTADEAIELAGDRVCTTCFPQAPVAAQERPSALLTKDEAQKAQERAERAQKAAQRAAKAKANAILDPETGEALTVSTGGRFTETFKTERAAWIHMVDQMWYQRFYGVEEHRTEVISQITRAIAVKHGSEVGDVRAEAMKKLAARIKREG